MTEFFLFSSESSLQTRRNVIISVWFQICSVKMKRQVCFSDFGQLELFAGPFFPPSLVWQVFGVVSGPFPEESDFLRTSEKLFVFNSNLKTDKLWLFFRSLRNWNETKMFRLVPVSNFRSFGTLACFSQEREKCDDLHIFDMFSSPGILSGLFITTLVPYWSEIVVFEVSTSWCSVVRI